MLNNPDAELDPFDNPDYEAWIESIHQQHQDTLDLVEIPAMSER